MLGKCRRAVNPTLIQRSRFRDEENIGYDIVSAMDKSQHSLEWAGPVLLGQGGAEGRRNFISALEPHNPPGARQFQAHRFFDNSKKVEITMMRTVQPRSLARLPVSGGE
jgi:hypothetical protein